MCGEPAFAGESDEDGRCVDCMTAVLSEDACRREAECYARGVRLAREKPDLDRRGVIDEALAWGARESHEFAGYLEGYGY